MFDVGDSVTVTFNTVDASGNPADVTTATVTVTDPTGVQTTPTVTHAATGRYTAVVVGNRPGRWLVSWTSTGPNASAYRDVLDFTDNTTDPLILSLAEARTALGLSATDTTRDSDLRDYIATVATIVEDIVGPVLPGTRTVTFDGGVGQLLLPDLPATGTITVTETGRTLVEGTDFTVDRFAGIITRGVGIPTQSVFALGLQNITVTYQVGTGTTANGLVIPGYIRTAARIILAWLWQSDQQGYRPAFGQPDQSTVQTPSGYELPRKAYRLLAGHMNVPGFA